jgi:hypothetical protein
MAKTFIKIEHLCCQPSSRFKAVYGQHLYQCTGCGQTKRGIDKTTLLWRRKHSEECFTPTVAAYLEESGTQADFLAAVKQGKVVGIKHDSAGPRSTRYTWRVK